MEFTFLGFGIESVFVWHWPGWRSQRLTWFCPKLKSEYNVITHLKGPASGFNYSDDKEAIVDEATKTFANEEMAINNFAATAPASSGAIPPIPPSSTNFTNPNTIFASTPSAYLSHPLQSTILMASTTMTSVSQKQTMASAPGSNIVLEDLKKWSCPLSVATQTQAEKDSMLWQLNLFLNNVDPAALKPVILVSLGLSQPQLLVNNNNNNYVEQAANALKSFDLDPSQVNTLADYISKLEHMLHIKFFIKMKKDMQELWIANTLTKIQAKKDVKVQRWSMDSGGLVKHHC